MKFENRQAFPGPRERLLRMFTDPTYFERKYVRTGASDIKVLEYRLQGDEFFIRCRFLRPTDTNVPAFARKFLAEKVEVTQSDRWNLKTATGELQVEVKNLPAQITARMLIEDDPAGCANVLRFEVRCSLPLIGGKIEEVVGNETRARLVEDHAVSRDLLGGY